MALLTRISSAKKGTKSLKTTIPEGVVEFLELSDQAELEWKMEVVNNDRSVTIKKTMINRVAHNKHNNPPFPYVAHGSPVPRSYEYSIDHREDNLKSSRYNPHEQLTNEPKPFAEYGGLTSKLQEIRRLAIPYFQPDILDEKLRNLSQRVMNGTESEAFVDECLEKIRSMNGQIESFSRLFTRPLSNAEENPLYNHRQNLHLRELSDNTKLKLSEIKRVLNSYRHETESWEIVEYLINRCSTAGNNPILDEALVFHKRQAGIIK
jgi:hypothetical protein